jgi:CRISPR-associated protein Cas5d
MSKLTVLLKVSGELACWTRPDQKVERVSYEVMTPSAARNILDAILWKPEIRWVVTRISVLRPIAFQAIRRNELQGKIAPRSVARWMADPATFEPQAAGAGTEDATPRNTLALRDVAYIIEAYPHVYAPNAEDTPVKYIAMLNRRVEKGQCFHRPALGCREFAASFEHPGVEDRPIAESRELGWMLYDIVFRDGGSANRPIFFKAALQAGVLATDPALVLKDAAQQEEVLACSYKR